MIRAYRATSDPTTRIIEIIRLVMLLLILVGWVMYPVELLVLEHWASSWQSKIPFLISIPGFIFTAWMLYDRTTGWARLAFILTMWASVLVGLFGVYFHVLWNFEEEVKWSFAKTMEAVAGSRPTLAALAFTHMGVTGLLSIYRAR